MQRTLWIIAGILGLLLVHAGLLFFMGQPLVCECAQVSFWYGGAALDPQNSQQFADWYSLSHIIHGIFFYALLTFLFPRLPLSVRILGAMAIEMSWELFENTDMVINHYRQQALAEGYSGYSVLNSLGDVVCAGVGAFAASRLRVWMTIALVIALELLALYAIHDNLTLNIIQFIHPIDAIGAWQASI